MGRKSHPSMAGNVLLLTGFLCTALLALNLFVLSAGRLVDFLLGSKCFSSLNTYHGLVLVQSVDGHYIFNQEMFLKERKIGEVISNSVF